MRPQSRRAILVQLLWQLIVCGKRRDDSKYCLLGFVELPGGKSGELTAVPT
jgi:hypothetical protein